MIKKIGISLILLSSILFANNINYDKASSIVELMKNKTVIGWNTYTKKNIIKPKINTINLPIIFFDFKKSNIKKQYKKVLNQIIKQYYKNPSKYILLKGYTDKIGNNKYNKILSLKRINSVKKYLIKHNIPVDKILIKNYGKKDYLSDYYDNLNRRVEIYFINYK